MEVKLLPFTYNAPFFSIFLALLSAVSVPFLKNGEQALRMIRVVQAVVAALSAALLAHLPLLARFGFEAEDFGGGAILVRSAPSDVAAGEIPDVLGELAGKLLTCGTADPESARDALLHTMACKAAIKGGQKNSPAELYKVAQAVLSGAVKYCPHGRPVAIELTRKDLEKQFRRA